MELKELFGDKQLSYEELENIMQEKGAKFADLSEGKYVDKAKYTTDLTEQKKLATQYKKDYDDLAESIKGDEGYEAKVSKLQKDLEDYKAKFEKADSELQFNSKLAKVSEAGVAKEFQKFVVSEVESKVTDNVSFDDALKAYTEANKQFMAGKKMTKNSSLSFLGGEDDEVENTVLSAFRKGAGLKEKEGE